MTLIKLHLILKSYGKQGEIIQNIYLLDLSREDL